MGARQAFAVSSHADSPLSGFVLKNIDIEAQTAGTIQNAEGWSFENARIRTADGSRVTLKESKGVTGL